MLFSPICFPADFCFFLTAFLGGFLALDFFVWTFGLLGLVVLFVSLSSAVVSATALRAVFFRAFFAFGAAFGTSSLVCGSEGFSEEVLIAAVLSAPFNGCWFCFGLLPRRLRDFGLACVLFDCVF